MDFSGLRNFKISTKKKELLRVELETAAVIYKAHPSLGVMNVGEEEGAVLYKL
jgi:hypothetical protein